MAKRKLIHIGDEEEAYLKNVIAGDIPKVTQEAVESIGKRKEESKTQEAMKPQPSEIQTDELKVKTETGVKEEVRKEAPSRSAGRKRKEALEFEDLFLVKRAYGEKRQIYINKDIYNRILRYMKVIAPEVSISIHFDNILLKYLEDYEDTINELYNKCVNTPI